LGKLVRDILFDYLRDLQVEYMFGVPGTNEIPIIDGTKVPGSTVTYVPCLHENIAMGAAMGYARMSGKPGLVQLHVTPGVGHSLGNLFNAFKSHVPVVVLCGQQHSQLLLQEPLLASDTVQVARQYCKWAYEIRSSQEAAQALQRAFKVAMAPPAGPVFVSIPWDFLLQEVTYTGEGKVTRIAPRFTGDPEAVKAAAHTLARAKSPVIVAGDGVGYSGAWEEIERLSVLIGAPVYTEYQSSLMNYPNHLPHWQGELPGLQEEIQKRFAIHDVAFLVGFNAQAQLVVFDYDKGPLIPDSVKQIYLHNDPWEIGKNHYGEVAILGDIKATLPALYEAIFKHADYSMVEAVGRNQHIQLLSVQRDKAFDAYNAAISQAAATSMEKTAQALVPTAAVAQTLAKLQAEQEEPFVYVHEVVSEGSIFQKYLAYDQPDAYFATEGGSLGYSMPATLGIKLAAGKNRVVVNGVGDGATLFYPQTWWTAAKFNLPVLYLVLNNREYKTLLVGLNELTHLYNWKPSGTPDYLYLETPQLSFVEIAATFGVDGQLVQNQAELDSALRRGLDVVKAGNPYVLEILVERLQSGAPAPAVPRLDVVYAAKEGER
jgi:benzoylformate decarboxylase